MNLYEIDNAILDCVDMETGEILDVEKLEALSMERDEKIENICLWIKNLKADAEALKEEKMAFAQRQKVAENKMESLKKYLTSYLAGAKFKTAKVQVSFRKSETVEISEGAQVPEEFLKYKEPEVDKTGLKKAIKEGRTFEGVQMVENQNIQIK